ncbi:RISC-loading complex subunit tarbp2-like [Lingula anatina]|uniref:RISC-loading complex subunit tarbp2-like n=1 Tax=Lingula anatina TaxID=7574 RepID=A0A1S3I2Y3_LINAN|nr:RISC-loading complex subunit tarbp2-like [Lingula anatina]|eukprot:XP_013392191.1 RISC-loading complex subunit tarbp2-like [Lingula anatina]
MIGQSSYREVAAPTTTVDGAGDNPVGELQELAQKRLLSPPQYEITSVRGPPHDREFVCNVKLGRITKRGTGKSKKKAKCNAAMKMMQAVDVTSLSQEDLDCPWEEEDGDALMDSSKSAYADLKKGKKIPTLTPFVSRKISSFYTQLKNASGKKLNRLHTTSLNTPASNFCQLLQEIAEEQCFEVTYVDLQELSYKGHRQCLVQLSTMPVAVCHGSGPTSDECHANAAHNALQYLKIMTKKA